MKKFWNFNKPEPNRGELMLYGEIAETSWWGDEVTPKQFKADLDALGDVNQLDIYINSGGGDVFAGVAIYNILKRNPAKKTVRVDGLAASIASVIAMAGDEIVMAENAMMMIHEAWTYASGNKREIRKVADELERIDGMLIGTYAARTDGEEEDISAMLEAETWMTAAEAVEKGFADRVETGLKVAASVRGHTLVMNGQKFDLSRYQHPPEIKNAVESVEVVYGPPCSGKSTYARENMGENDIVYDYDRLIHAMTTQENRSVEKTAAHEIALGIRGLIIARAHEETPVKKAFILTRWPTDNLRAQLEGLTVTETRMEADEATCLARLEADEERVDKPAWAEIIRKWFADHGGEGQPVADKTRPEGRRGALMEQRKKFAAMRRKILQVYEEE